MDNLHSGFCSNQDTLVTIKSVFERTGYSVLLSCFLLAVVVDSSASFSLFLFGFLLRILLDPHTAVGKTVVDELFPRCFSLNFALLDEFRS